MDGPASSGWGKAHYLPLCWVLYSREGTALFRLVCSVLYSTRGGRLSTVPCVRFYVGISVAFRVSDIPPLSGGSKLNNSTCVRRQEKKKAAPSTRTPLLIVLVHTLVLSRTRILVLRTYIIPVFLAVSDRSTRSRLFNIVYNGTWYFG